MWTFEFLKMDIISPAALKIKEPFKVRGNEHIFEINKNSYSGLNCFRQRFAQETKTSGIRGKRRGNGSIGRGRAFPGVHRT